MTETKAAKKTKLEAAEDALAEKQLAFKEAREKFLAEVEEFEANEEKVAAREAALVKAEEDFATRKADSEVVVVNIPSDTIPLHVLNAMAKRSNKE